MGAFMGVFKAATISFLALSTSSVFSQDIDVKFATDIFGRKDSQDDQVDAIYWADQVKLDKNQKLIFKESARVYVKDLELEDLAVIESEGNDLEIYVENEMDLERGVFQISPDADVRNTSGQDGQNGEHGEKALDGLKGTAGSHGADGSDGSDGADAKSITIITPVIRGDLILLARGGSGGRGGNGGHGGKGGAGLSGQDARVLYNFRGMSGLSTDTLLGIGSAIGVPYVGQVLAVMSLFNGLTIGDGFDGFDGGAGGDAGSAGNGGNGGNGGDIKVIYGVREGPGRTLYSTRGGVGGAGGSAGVAGVGGTGGAGGQAGDIWGRDGNPGRPGELGQRGHSGLPGQSGDSGSIYVAESGDQKWLGCYVRYKTILDVMEDREFAKQALQSCMLE